MVELERRGLDEACDLDALEEGVSSDALDRVPMSDEARPGLRTGWAAAARRVTATHGRNAAAGVGLALLAAVSWSSPQATEAARKNGPVAEGPVLIEAAAAARATAPEPLPPEEDPDLGPATVDGPLRGLSGAATALAIGDTDRALALSAAALPQVEKGSEQWFHVGALRGRAWRLAERPEKAVAELAPLWSHRGLGQHFPKEVLGFELAKAKVEWARQLDAARGDAQRKEAIALLGRVRRLSPIRNFAEVRVLQADALLEMKGSTPKQTLYAARKAVRATEDILQDYPNHPRWGELALTRAVAMARGGDERGAASTLRSLHIERAGEPESEKAWLELEKLAGQHKRVQARPLSIDEQLDRAFHARRLRWVALSREILDRIIADPDTPSVLESAAVSSRAWTAYKQRDFKRCADDLRPWYERTGNYGARDRLLRCLERGGMYDEAIEIWLSQTKSKRRGMKAYATWEAMEMAYRGGKYERAAELLEDYSELSKGHRQARAWLSAWFAMRLGKRDEAIAGFEEAERYRSDRTRARYFRGKLLLQGDAEQREQGASLLRAIITNDPLDYYGLQARQRLLDAGIEPPAPPDLEPVQDEATHPTRAQTEEVFASLDEEFGDAWPVIRRAHHLYLAGYLEEARREVRVAAEAYLTGGSKPGGPRNESCYKGLGWKADWSYPRISPTRAGRKTLRDREAREHLRVGLRELARGVDEPYRVIRLSRPEDGDWKARWHPRAYRWAVEREARLRGIDPVHMWSLMYTESRFRRFVVSPVGARGALQIMPWTARQLARRLGELENGTFDDDSLFDIDTNAHLSGSYVAELLKKFHGQAPPAYASYNGGPSNVARWMEAKSKAPTGLDMDEFIEEIAFRETYRYTRRVVEVSAAYGLLYDGKLPRWPNKVDPNYEDNIDF